MKVPDKRNEALWCHMLLGGAAWRRICAARDREEEAAAAKLEVEGDQPALNFVMTMSGVACEQVRGHICLRSRPVDPTVTCPSVRGHDEMTYRMTG